MGVRFPIFHFRFHYVGAILIVLSTASCQNYDHLLLTNTKVDKEGYRPERIVDTIAYSLDGHLLVKPRQIALLHLSELDTFLLDRMPFEEVDSTWVPESSKRSVEDNGFEWAPYHSELGDLMISRHHIGFYHRYKRKWIPYLYQIEDRIYSADSLTLEHISITKFKDFSKSNPKKWIELSEKESTADSLLFSVIRGQAKTDIAIPDSHIMDDRERYIYPPLKSWYFKVGLSDLYRTVPVHDSLRSSFDKAGALGMATSGWRAAIHYHYRYGAFVGLKILNETGDERWEGIEISDEETDQVEAVGDFDLHSHLLFIGPEFGIQFHLYSSPLKLLSSYSPGYISVVQTGSRLGVPFNERIDTWGLEIETALDFEITPNVAIGFELQMMLASAKRVSESGNIMSLGGSASLTSYSAGVYLSFSLGKERPLKFPKSTYRKFRQAVMEGRPTY